MLVSDATDHRLVQAFFDLDPKKGQIHSARRIWRSTAKQIMVEEEVACLECRLSARSLQPSSTLFDRMIDDIDATEQTSPTECERMKQLKKEIIHRCIATGHGMADSYHSDVLHEQKKYFVKRGVDESTAEWQSKVIQAMETRRLHMLERSTCVIQLKLATTFNNN